MGKFSQVSSHLLSSSPMLPPVQHILIQRLVTVKSIENLSGHSINRYQIHGDKSILLVKNDDPRKMEEGEYFAIETFGTTGRGRIIDGVNCRAFFHPDHHTKRVVSSYHHRESVHTLPRSLTLQMFPCGTF